MLMDELRIRAAEGTWVVLAGDAVIGESARALELSEPHSPPVIYFPREDLAMVLLDASETTWTCPVKGQAQHFHVSAINGTIRDAGWSFETPGPEAERIAGHIAFASDKVTLRQG